MLRQLRIAVSIFLLPVPLSQSVAEEDLRSPQGRFVSRGVTHVLRNALPRKRAGQCRERLKKWLGEVFIRKPRRELASGYLQACYGPFLYARYVPSLKFREQPGKKLPTAPSIMQVVLRVLRSPVQIRMLCCGIAYIRIKSFDANVAKFMGIIASRKYNELRHKHRFVIDLRSNPGGYVSELEELVGWFAPHKKQIAYYQVRSHKDRAPRIVTRVGFLQKQIWVVIIADHETASASEMLIAILKHWHGSKVRLIGSRTYGKGTIQSVIGLAGLRVGVTSARWYVGGRSYDVIGIRPDIKIPTAITNGKDVALQRAIRLLGGYAKRRP